jgi:hypothetical protein
MSDFFRTNTWSKPFLAIPSSLWEELGLGTGFLTPTPTKLPNGNIRVFGGVRDINGRSTIHWVDLNSMTSEVMNYSKRPCFDTRESLDFDTDGAILGDIFSYKGGLGMFYVGFKRYSDVKFRAFTGFAHSSDFGILWKKELSPINELQKRVNNSDIFAVHNVRVINDNVELLIALGDGWENIGGKNFPRYSSFRAFGKSFDDLEISAEVLLPQSPDIYRLGRPRFFRNSQGNIEYVVATGGKRDGDYRPYIFEKENDRWIISELQFPVLPGMNAGFALQVSYPAYVELDHSTWIFFDGDEMGKSGSYLIRSDEKASV